MSETNSNIPEHQTVSTVVEVPNTNTQNGQEPDERDLKIAALESELTTLRAREAVSTSQRVNTAIGKPVTNGTLEATRLRAIDAAGGNALWHSLSPERRAEILGCTDTKVPDEELRKIFGPTSDANAASRMATASPTKYRSWKILAKEKGIY
jgi:hypothetical protein